jgi:hypothetical protein
MIYINNYAEWIDAEWVYKVLTQPGYARPRDWKPAYEHESLEYTKAANAGYKLDDVHFWLYEESNLAVKIVPPWIKGKYHWWITKMYPGQFTPMHSDPHTVGEKCVRYWMPLLDSDPGHVFLYKDTAIVNYKAGDLYQYEHAQDVHGAANIGHTPRIVLQVTEFL